MYRQGIVPFLVGIDYARSSFSLLTCVDALIWLSVLFSFGFKLAVEALPISGSPFYAYLSRLALA